MKSGFDKWMLATESSAGRHAAGVKTIALDNKLIIGTGGSPVRPDLPGVDLDGVFLAHTRDDSFAVKSLLSRATPKRAVILGAGCIGFEVADAVTQCGSDVTLLSRTETVLPTVDAALGRMVSYEMTRHGVSVLTGVSATRIEPTPGASSRLFVGNSIGGPASR